MIFLIVVFLALIVSAYSQYQLNLQTAGLVDTASSITNELILNNLALDIGGRTQEYVVDAAKISSLSFRQEVGGDNFEFLIKLSYNPEAERVLGPYGPGNITSPPAGRTVSVISVPVTLYENGRFSYAKLEVQVWRA